MSHLDQMQAKYPEYGGEEHQREFCARMDALEKDRPCPIDHMHTTKCYETPPVAKPQAEVAK